MPDVWVMFLSNAWNGEEPKTGKGMLYEGNECPFKDLSFKS